jgi:hypothetical protein
MSGAPERIHVRWGKAGDTRATYMEERFLPPDNGAEYIRADVSAARIADLERQLAEARDKALEEAALRIDANPDPCSPAYPSAWTDDQISHYDSGQLDAANSFAYAIRAMKGTKP